MDYRRPSKGTGSSSPRKYSILGFENMILSWMLKKYKNFGSLLRQMGELFCEKAKYPKNKKNIDFICRICYYRAS